MWNDNAIEMFKLLFQQVLSSIREEFIRKTFIVYVQFDRRFKEEKTLKELKVDGGTTERHIQTNRSSLTV